MTRHRTSAVGAFLTLGALPRSADLGLLTLRLFAGGPLLALHGWPKLQRLLGDAPQFADPLGIGAVPSLVLATTAEVLGAALLMIGLATRWAALGIMIPLLLAIMTVHGGTLRGENNGELPFLFVGMMLAVFVAGPGRFSVDAQLDARVDDRAGDGSEYRRRRR